MKEEQKYKYYCKYCEVIFWITKKEVKKFNHVENCKKIYDLKKLDEFEKKEIIKKNIILDENLSIQELAKISSKMIIDKLQGGTNKTYNRIVYNEQLIYLSRIKK